jgi:hypothetical protein
MVFAASTTFTALQFVLFRPCCSLSALIRLPVFVLIVLLCSLLENLDLRGEVGMLLLNPWFDIHPTYVVISLYPLSRPLDDDPCK